MQFVRFILLCAPAVSALAAADAEADALPLADANPAPDAETKAPASHHPHHNPAPTYCTSKQIDNMDVGQCKCRPWGKGCKTNCDACKRSKDKTVTKGSCSTGCTESEADCFGCGLYFSSVCHCLQNPGDPSVCAVSKKVSPGGSLWMHLKTGAKSHDLVTTNKLVPGILDMASPAGSYFHESGWVYAQERWDDQSQALAMNPWLVRTQEQVHIHLCPANAKLRTALDGMSSLSDKKLERLPLPPGEPETYCLTRWAGHRVTNFMEALGAFIAKKGGCEEEVGAGMIKDKQGRTWACATLGHYGPLPQFCSK